MEGEGILHLITFNLGIHRRNGEHRPRDDVFLAHLADIPPAFHQDEDEVACLSLEVSQ